MIRDPSDGSVRETPAVGIPMTLPKAEPDGVVPSGLPTASSKPAMQAKLEKSRAWLKDYHSRKAAE
jgi:hypothetical protein